MMRKLSKHEANAAKTIIFGKHTTLILHEAIFQIQTNPKN